MKKAGIVLVVFLGFSSLVCAAQRGFRFYADKITAMKAKPREKRVENTLLILHPLIKNRKSKSVITGEIRWNGDKAMIKFGRIRHVSGRKMRVRGGKPRFRPFLYPPKMLKALLTGARISGWRYDSAIKLEKKVFPGYRFTAVVKGITRDGAVCLKSGRLYAVSLAFNKKGISHARNMSEKGYVWYFVELSGGIRLTGSLTTEARKSNGIPVITVSRGTYSRF